jgi:hypothetical protein
MKMRRINRKAYTHYVVVSIGGMPFIESGWEYVEDAKDQTKNGNLPDGVKAKVLTKVGLKRGGVDPDNDANWAWIATKGDSAIWDRAEGRR